MVVLALRVLAEPTVVPVRRAIALGLCALDVCCTSIGLCAFDVNRTEMWSRYMLFCVVRLCCPVYGPRCAVPGCAPAGTMVVLALRVIASGCTRARRVLTEPKIVYARRK